MTFAIQLPTIISWLNQQNSGVLWLLQLLFVYASILFMLRYFGRQGLFILMGLFLISANIQVNKLTLLPGFSDPMPLGNVLIAGTYLCSDTLAEYFSANTARRAIWLGFTLFILMVICVTFTLGFKPLSLSAATTAGVSNPEHIQAALLTVFGTAPALLVSSLTSFLISQFFDVAVFMRLKKITNGRYLWLRNNASTLLAAWLDNCVFNILAWRVFAAHPIPWHTLWSSYIVGTYFIRVIVSVMDTPFIYCARYFIPKKSLAKPTAQ